KEMFAMQHAHRYRRDSSRCRGAGRRELRHPGTACRGGRADIADAALIKLGLQSAVLSPAAVQHGEDDIRRIDLAQHLAGTVGSVSFDPPGAVPIDDDGYDAVSLLQRGNNIRA